MNRENLESLLRERTGQLAEAEAELARQSERLRKAESALPEISRRFDAALDNIPEGIMIIDVPGGEIRLINAYMAAWTGISKEEAQGNTFEIIDKHLKTSGSKAFPLSRVMDTGETVQGEEWQVETIAGDILSIIIMASPIRDLHGKMTGAVTTWRDITAVKRTEAAAAESEARFRTLADNMSQLAWMADADGWIFWYNNRWYDYTGATFEEMQGWGWRKVHHPDHVRRVEEKFRKSLKEGTFWEDTFPLLGKEGKYRWFLSRAVPIRDADGRILRWFGTNTDITEQRNAEERFRHTSERLAGILEAMTDAFIGIDRNWHITDLNPMGERILNKKRDELLGCDLRGVYADPDAQRFISRYARAMTDNAAAEFEDYYGPFGKWIDIRAFPTREGLSIFFRDITGRKQAEIDIERSRRWLERIAETTPDIIFVLDIAANRIKYTNRSISGILGYSPEELAGMENVLEKSVISEELEKSSAFYRDMATAVPGEVRVMTNDTFHKDGSLRRIESRVTPFTWDTEGRLVEVLGIARDVTEIEAAGRALKESERKYRELIETTNSIILRWLPDGTVSFMNQYGLDFFGYRKEEIIGKDVGMLVPEQESTGRRLETLIPDITRHPEKYAHNENENIRKNGERVWVIWSNKAVNDDNGSLREVLAVGNDITELKHSQKRLQESNRDLEQFAYVASHDLQEPLRMVASYTELLGRRYRDRLDERGIGYMKYIVDGANRMQRLIQDLLTFSRVGRRDMPRRLIGTERIIKEAISVLSEMIRETGATVTHDPLPEVTANETGMAQLFQNLIGNAIKFRKENESPRIHISSKNTGFAWQFSVSDNGIGIDEKYFDKLFIIFQRLHSRDKYPGTGIGLAVSKKIVEAHGGQIWAESVPGEGATFYFTIPF